MPPEPPSDPLPDRPALKRLRGRRVPPNASDGLSGAERRPLGRPPALVPGGRLPGGGRAMVPRMPCACQTCEQCGQRICVAASFAVCMGEYNGRHDVCACYPSQLGTPPSPWG